MNKRLPSIALASVLLFSTIGLSVTGAQGATATASLDPKLVSSMETMSATDSVTVIVTYAQKPGSTELAALKAIGVQGGQLFQELPMIAATMTKDQIQQVASFSGIESIYMDKPFQYFLDTSVPLIGASKNRETSSMGFSGKNVGVAVVDTGVDATHPDLKFGTRVKQNVKVPAGPSLVDFVAPVYVEDVPDTDNGGGHGTHVAGTIGGDGTASGGKYEGVAPAADIIGISTGAGLSLFTTLEGFDYVLTHQYQYNIQVVSNSWGTSGAYDPKDPTNIASKKLHDRGITVVFAAGNAGPGADTMNPYSLAPWVIGVAAGDKKGNLADFSSRGIKGSTTVHPTITAPGVDIISARAKESALTPLAASKDAAMIPTAYQPYYTTLSGTSMATPHISGVIALLEQANPSLTPDDIKEILTSTATRMPGYEEYETGVGYVNAYAAIDKAQHMEKTYGAVLNQTFKSKFSGAVQNTVHPEQSWDPFSGDVTYTLQVGSNSQMMDLLLTWDDFTNLFTMKITDPAGTTTTVNSSLLASIYGSQIAKSIENPIAGTWTITVSGARGTVVGVPDTLHLTSRIYSGTFSGLSDVSADNPYAPYIRRAVSKRLMDSVSTSEFKPDALISKGELAKTIASAAEIRQNLTSTTAFKDVSSDLLPYVNAVVADGAPMRDVFWQYGGVMSGKTATEFGSKDAVSRAALAMTLVKTLGLEDLAQQNMNTQTSYTDDADIPAWARGYVVVASQKGIMKGFSNPSLIEGAAPTYSFKPNDSVSRGGLAVALNYWFDYFRSGN